MKKVSKKLSLNRETLRTVTGATSLGFNDTLFSCVVGGCKAVLQTATMCSDVCGRGIGGTQATLCGQTQCNTGGTVCC